MHAISKKYGFPYVKFLLEMGADVNAVDSTNRTALIMACHWGRKSIFEELLKYNPDVNISANTKAHNATALTSCFLKGNFEMARRLLFRGACPAKAMQSHFMKSLSSEEKEKIAKFTEPFKRWREGKSSFALCRSFYQQKRFMEHSHVKIMENLSYVKFRMILNEYL